MKKFLEKFNEIEDVSKVDCASIVLFSDGSGRFILDIYRQEETEQFDFNSIAEFYEEAEKYLEKHKPEYRPFETVEEVEKEFGKYASRKNKHHRFMIMDASYNGIAKEVFINDIPANAMFEHYTIDGHPAGVKIGGYNDLR